MARDDDPREKVAIDRYRNYTINFYAPPIPSRAFDWHYQHDDYDGAPDSHDHRSGDAPSFNACKEEIDENYEREEDETTTYDGQACGDRCAWCGRCT